MEKAINILIVEDEAILAMALCDSLELEGYCVIGMASNGTKALDLFRRNEVDLVLCDINIRGDIDGIETIRQLMTIRPVPVIYLTAFSDTDTVHRAKQTGPAAYMTKPHNLLNLRIAIDLAMHNFVQQTQLAETVPIADLPASPTLNENAATVSRTETVNRDTILKIDDYIFIKQGFQFVKINLTDILILEAEDNYTYFVTTGKRYILRLSLSAALERLQFPRMVRVHRSFAVNVRQVDTFDEQTVTLNGHTVPLGKNYKEDFLRSLHV
jgi:two-component system, response regulator PdtaR